MKGLENLKNLEFLNLYENPIPDEIFEEIGDNYDCNGQRFVNYCLKRNKVWNLRDLMVLLYILIIDYKDILE